MMRIITGSAKGIRLKTLEGDLTRPTAERVKEAVFSMLSYDIEGRTVLDLFSGSGQMALEALSRGAANAVTVDRSPDAVKVIRENAVKTKLASKCEIICSDCLAFIKKNQSRKFDIVFLDPPYASALYAPALMALLEYGLLKPDCLIICESDSQDFWNNDTETAEKFNVVKKAKYGRVYITVISPKEA